MPASTKTHYTVTLIWIFFWYWTTCAPFLVTPPFDCLVFLGFSFPIDIWEIEYRFEFFASNRSCKYLSLAWSLCFNFVWGAFVISVHVTELLVFTHVLCVLFTTLSRLSLFRPWCHPELKAHVFSSIAHGHSAWKVLPFSKDLSRAKFPFNHGSMAVAFPSLCVSLSTKDQPFTNLQESPHWCLERHHHLGKVETL